jgi:hypothetical protein
MNPTSPTSHLEDSPAQLERYGIVRYSTDHFVIGGYRYSRLEDAVAEAKRRLLSTRDGS